MKNTESKLLSAERNARLGLYCAAGAGAAVLAGTVTTADAAIVFINFNNQVFSDSTPQDGASTYFTSGTAGNFDFNTDGTIDFRLRQRDYTPSGSLLSAAGFAGPTAGTIDVIGVSSGGYLYGNRLSAGTMIGPGGPFITLAGGATAFLASNGGFPNSQWVNPSAPASGFIGVRFTAGGNTYYGWVGLSVAAQNAAIPYAITLSGIAYNNTPNTPIVAGDMGAIPEPASLALLALGGVGLMAYRKMQTKKAA